MLKEKERNLSFGIIVLIIVLFLTIGYSAFERNLLIDDIALTVRAIKDIRVTGTWQTGITNGAESSFVDYNVKSSILSFNLPRESSTITYTIQVTNIGNVDMGIFEITGLPENMEYELTNYTLKEKICNEQRCNKGIQKEFQITIKYKSGNYQSSSTNFNVTLNFDFRSYHTVTYEDFESPTTSYPTEVMDGDDYNFTFPGTAPKELQVLMGGVETTFEYENNRLIVRNVTDDLKIITKKSYFATDDWETIKENVNTDRYNVGEEREVELEGFGTFTLRLVNKSTPPECADPNFSQTACGFVVEFEDIITTHNMNSSSTNVGGWPASAMKKYLDSDIYSALPKELQDVIIETKSISGHGSSDTGDGPGNNWVSNNDKLYLLSPHEVWENGTSYEISNDIAWDYTRQLDYYYGVNTTTNNYSPAIKKNASNSAYYWWLRGATSRNSTYFYLVHSNGGWSDYNALGTYGVAPAFRIGEKPEVPPVSFTTDDWDVIKENIDSDVYNVGDEREVELEGLGTFTLRLVNKSTPPECADPNFSQTACGFVVEFEDIITRYNMKPSATNVGGWPASAMKKYLDSTIFSALPSELQAVIIETKSISGRGLSDTGDGPRGSRVSNNDKLYLLSPHEVWENGKSNKITNDTAWDYTRQLDYYYGVNTTTNNYSPAIKKNSSNSASFWWLRGANSIYDYGFYDVSSSGGWNYYNANTTYGVAPAFRIG